jgi:hypothetical protein
VQLDLSAGTASVAGGLHAKSEQALILFNQAKTLVIHIVPKAGQYHVSDLPADQYYIGNLYLADSAPLAEFSLEEGQALNLDLDTQNWLTTGQGLLSVEIYGQDGLPLPAASVWLEDDNGQIDPLLVTDTEILFIAPVGNYRLVAYHSGFTEQSQEVTIKPNDIITLNPKRPVIRLRLDAQYPSF